ncbi:unnamed protein product [Acanthoscelides obtectus]|uniref:TWiK family of potassium channels protein 18 n=1 Tax=Acanthoscelides obtectus TaxID=200917 RepID=A0A9P0L8C6_ACAOB|nr:unnamed protein product [Acanthoscelides obtectus]CAK1649105.1 hypothetical protein AOBTE_LOCUS16045 [Acanthoscelides obtectus]
MRPPAVVSSPSAYQRRVSPPGSPSAANHRRQCCYDKYGPTIDGHGHSHLEDVEQQQQVVAASTSVFCCCYTCPGNRSTSLLATLGVCFLVLGYTILGAFIFMALEGGLYQDTAVAASKANPKSDNTVIGELRTETVDRLWSITENLNILYRENWTRLAAEEVLVFQEALLKILRNTETSYVTSGTGTMTYYQNFHKWSFSSSFLYSLTLITTIGK